LFSFSCVFWCCIKLDYPTYFAQAIEVLLDGHGFKEYYNFVLCPVAHEFNNVKDDHGAAGRARLDGVVQLRVCAPGLQALYLGFFFIAFRCFWTSVCSFFLTRGRSFFSFSEFFDGVWK
jgi:hypothetical protein